jgi:pheromone shutdown-related protein TraB
METAQEPISDNPDLTRIDLAEKTVYLLGTAHISRHSVEAVRRAVDQVRPECVCVELDIQRLESLRDPCRWRDLNLMKALREGRGAFLLANLALSSFQRRLGLETGVLPGAELLEAVSAAEARGLRVELIDRPIRTTLLRAWRAMGFWKKSLLAATILSSVFERTGVSEEDLAQLREKDALSALLEEVGRSLPAAKGILIDERDTYMASKIRRAPGARVLAIVGAGHVPGITRQLAQPVPGSKIEALEVIPPLSSVSRLIPWIVPALVLGLFAAGFFAGDTSKLTDAAMAWILSTGGLASVGAVLALGHPVTIASAFAAAPITTLHPAVGAGMVTGAVQAWVGKPRVHDLEHLLDDLTRWKGWWANRVARVFLVFLFSNLGASLGTLVAFGWLKNLL